MLRLGLLALTLVTLAACGGSSPEDERAAGDPAASAPAASAVALEGETLEGARLSLADLRGNPVFVNVWASW